MAMLILGLDGLYRDPDLYDLPDRFIPERYLASEFGTKAGADTTGLRYDLHFGSGRVSILNGVQLMEPPKDPLTTALVLSVFVLGLFSQSTNL